MIDFLSFVLKKLSIFAPKTTLAYLTFGPQVIHSLQQKFKTNLPSEFEK